MSNRQKDFIAEIKTQGLARTNRFTVQLTPPGSAPAVTRKVLLFCEQASLPGINYATTQNRTYGELREMPYDKLYDNITLTFHVDRDMLVKKMFDDWMQFIQDPITRSFQYYRNYTTDMVIELQDLEDKTTYQIQMFECYPKAISAIALNAEAKDTMRVSVTFQYKYWSSNLIAENANGQKITKEGFNKYIGDFSGFQEMLRKGLGERGAGIVTGAVGQLATRSFSQVTSRIPAIRF
jgi:hypothetical protein